MIEKIRDRLHRDFEAAELNHESAMDGALAAKRRHTDCRRAMAASPSRDAAREFRLAHVEWRRRDRVWSRAVRRRLWVHFKLNIFTKFFG